jgi:hypothetical protein
MRFPLWCQKALQERVDCVSARIARHPDIRRLREEEDKAFQQLFANMDIVRSPEFSEWEDKHHCKHALVNEHLYRQGLQDGIQIAFALLNMLDIDETERDLYPSSADNPKD